MRSRTFSSEAIVLSRKNYSEADRILVVYSKHYGKISLLAKGVRKLKSKKRGALEVFSQIKFSAARGKNLDIVTEAELINSFPSVRKNLRKASVAYFLIEVVSHLTREEEKNSDLYFLILKNFKMLKVSRALKKLRQNFVQDVLTLLGFWPKGRKMVNPDLVLEEITERQMNSVRVGKKILS